MNSLVLKSSNLQAGSMSMTFIQPVAVPLSTRFCENVSARILSFKCNRVRHKRCIHHREHFPRMLSSALNADEFQAAQSALKVTQYFFSGSRESNVTTWDLLVYCELKGLKLEPGVNVWDRDRVERIAHEYHQREKEIRLIDSLRQEHLDSENARHDETKWWDGLTSNNKVDLLHRACNAEGEATYTDPDTGYTVFSAFAHLKRGHCCGLVENEDRNKIVRTHRCRHCPYRDDGMVGSKNMLALKRRLHVIDYIRQALDQQLEFNEGDDAGRRTIDGESRGRKESCEEHVNSNDSNNDDEMSRVFDDKNMDRLRQRLVKRKQVVVVRDKNGNSPSCSTCGDERMVTCSRCNGFTWVFSPSVQVCPRCKGEGMHPCMKCTSYRPPAKTSLYSS